jgi:hypothetical protein
VKPPRGHPVSGAALFTVLDAEFSHGYLLFYINADISRPDLFFSFANWPRYANLPLTYHPVPHIA